MIGVLYSGGKESHYSIIEVMRKFRLNVKYLIRITPTRSNLHDYVSHILSIHAKLMNCRLISAEPSKLCKVLREYGISYLIAGDIYITEHVEWLEKICKQCDVELIEPLLNHDTEELLKEMIFDDVEFIVFAVKKGLENILGFKVCKENVQLFLKLIENLKIDPCGEFGEYHTIVIKSPILNYSIEAERYSTISFKNYTLSIPKYFRIKSTV